MINPEPDDSDNIMQQQAEQIEALKKELAAAHAKADEHLAGWQRAQADFINYRRRAEQEKEELTRSANARLMLSILPVLDDLERADAAIPPELESNGWVQGLRLIWRKLRSILELQGLSEIKAIGEPFDPHIHEAVMQGKGKEDCVIGEVQKGYRLYDRVLRPTKAIVGCGEEKEE